MIHFLQWWGGEILGKKKTRAFFGPPHSLKEISHGEVEKGDCWMDVDSHHKHLILKKDSDFVAGGVRSPKVMLHVVINGTDIYNFVSLGFFPFFIVHSSSVTKDVL